MIKVVSELDIFQAGRGIGVRRHHDLGQVACMGGTMVKIPLSKTSLGSILSTKDLKYISTTIIGSCDGDDSR
jgi:hypothetical protein